jgi:hypothetical protein
MYQAVMSLNLKEVRAMEGGWQQEERTATARENSS